MILSLVLFIAGKRFYRAVPAAGVNLPYEVYCVFRTAIKNYRKASPSEKKKSTSIISFAEGYYPAAFVAEVRDLSTMFLIL